MFSFTRKTDYALVALARLAEGAEGEGGEVLSSRYIAEQYGVPLPLLMNVMKDLVKGGLIRSIRGAKGGYVLAHSPQEISIASIVQTIEGPLKIALCCDGDEESACTDCNVMVKCPITDSVRMLNEQITGYLHRVSLSHLMKGEFAPIEASAAGPTNRGDR